MKLKKWKRVNDKTRQELADYFRVSFHTIGYYLAKDFDIRGPKGRERIVNVMEKVMVDRRNVVREVATEKGE